MLARVLPRCKNAMYAYSPYCSLYILTILERRICGTIGNLLRFLDTRKENFFSNQEIKSLLSWWSFFFSPRDLEV